MNAIVSLIPADPFSAWEFYPAEENCLFGSSAGDPGDGVHQLARAAKQQMRLETGGSRARRALRRRVRGAGNSEVRIPDSSRPCTDW